MGVVIEICIKYPGGRTRITVTGMLSYLCICIARYRTCVHSRYVRYVYQPPGAGPYLSIWLAAPRGAADIYVSLCFGPI